MKKNLNLTLGIITLLGGAVSALGKNKALKTVGFGTCLISGSLLLKNLFKEESEKVETQCKETEEIFETTGLDPERIKETSVSLLTGTEDSTPKFGKIILEEIYRGCIFPDEMLEYNRNSHLNTLHIMQNVEKNRIIVSIPLPPRTKGGLSPQEIREHYKQVFDNFISDNKLEMKNYLNQIGVVVTKDSSNPPYTYFEEILREEEENFHDYLTRVTSYQRESLERGKAPKGLVLDDGESFVRIDQYLNLEFPVFPEHTNKKGLDLISSMKLLKTLTETAYIKSASGREVAFDLNRIAFHPADDYGFIFVMKGGEIDEVDL